MTKREAIARLNYTTLTIDNVEELINWIFNEHYKEKLKLKKHDRLMRDKAHEFNTKVKKLEANCEELVSLPKGVESYSWSDYKIKKENK